MYKSIAALALLLAGCATTPQSTGFGTAADTQCYTHGGIVMLIDDTKALTRLDASVTPIGKIVICLDRSTYQYNSETHQFTPFDLDTD